MCFCLRQTDVNKLYLHRTIIAHVLLHLLAAAGEKRQHTETTVWPLPIVSLCLFDVSRFDVSFDSKKTLMVVSECSSSDPWFRPACIGVHTDALINTSAGLIHWEEGDIYQETNTENQTKAAEGNKTRETSVKVTRLTASAGLLNDRQTKCAIFEKLLKLTWCTANWRKSSMTSGRANVKEHRMWTGDCNTASAPKCRNHTNTWKELFQMIKYVF